MKKILIIIGSILVTISLFFGYLIAEKKVEKYYFEKSKDRILGYILYSIQTKGSIIIGNGVDTITLIPALPQQLSFDLGSPVN